MTNNNNNNNKYFEYTLILNLNTLFVLFAGLHHHHVFPTKLEGQTVGLC